MKFTILITVYVKKFLLSYIYIISKTYICKGLKFMKADKQIDNKNFQVCTEHIKK